MICADLCHHAGEPNLILISHSPTWINLIMLGPKQLKCLA